MSRAAPSTSPARSPAKRRPRGRPEKTEPEKQLIRDRILAATRAVYARTGYHGLSVDLVLAEAELSRPTFYKYFRSIDEPIEQILADVNGRLVQSLGAAVDRDPAPLAKLEAALLAWRAWGEELGPMIGALFGELHDVHSPASTHRRRTLALLHRRLTRAIADTGRGKPAPILVDALLNGIEFLGYRYHLHTPRNASSWRATRTAMLRLALGLLGTEGELLHARELSEALSIELRPDRV